MGWVVISTPCRFISGNDAIPILQDAGWAPGPVWTGAENLAHTGFRSLDRPAGSESRHRLSYAGPHKFVRVANVTRWDNSELHVWSITGTPTWW
jgi:hypothetical protein